VLVKEKTIPAPKNEDMMMGTIQWTLRNEVRPKRRIPSGQSKAPHFPATRRASGGAAPPCFLTLAR
jgi:hypothetical protein